MEQLLAVLLAIKYFSKDIHYASKSGNFWGDHLLADKIGNGMDDFVDRINEQIYLGWNKEAPKSTTILGIAYSLIPQTKSMWDGLDGLLKMGLDIANGLSSVDMTRQDNQLLDDIASDLQAKRGLLWRRLQ